MAEHFVVAVIVMCVHNVTHFVTGSKSRSRPKSGTSEMSSSTCSSVSSKKSTKSKKALNSSMKRSGQPSVNKTVTWRGLETYGYAAVVDTIPGRQMKKSKSATGTLGSGHIGNDEEQTSWQYIQDVKTTFHSRPSVYQEFVRILSEVRNPDSDKVEIVKRIIMLFDGYPNLILGFNYFLPRYIRLEIQEDAVIVKVDEDYDAFGEDDSDNEDDDSPTMRYIRNVKWTYVHHPEVYEQFFKVLKNFNGKRTSEVDTIHHIVSLFQDHPDLVLGFNFFLPEGYRVLANKKHGYVIQHPCQKGMKPHYTPVNVTESYPN